MSQAYDAAKMKERAVFELFYRRLPSARNYMVAAGLDDVLAFLESYRISCDDLTFLRESIPLDDAFLRRLRDVRFTGDVYAMPEGAVVFPNEPLIRIEAPILEGQLVETYILNQMHFQTLAASKASRIVNAAGDRTVIDFGSRRAHGVDAALKTARSSYLVGAAGTSNMLAGRRYGIPTFGTMAHSYIQAFDCESDAFEVYARTFPETTLLVDTYDTLEGIRKVIDLQRRLGEQIQVRAIRLDSGDLLSLACESRRLFDQAGMCDIRIIASSELNEFEIRRLRELDAPIDGFGVGASLAVSDDAPSLDMVYKLVQYAGKPRTKQSAGKQLIPGPKLVFRQFIHNRMYGDVIGRRGESLAGAPMLEQVMRDGERTQENPSSLAQQRRYAIQQFEQLPDSLKGVGRTDRSYLVQISEALQTVNQSIRQRRTLAGENPKRHCLS